MSNFASINEPSNTHTPATVPSTIASVRKLPPTLTVEQAAEILGCGRSLAYDLIRRNEFPCAVLRLGNRRYVIPTAGLLGVLGLGSYAALGGSDSSPNQP